MRKPAFCICEHKVQISCAVTAQLISAFVFAIRIVQSLYYLKSTFQASSHILWLYSPVCVGPGRKPRRPVSHNEAQIQFPHRALGFSQAWRDIRLHTRTQGYKNIKSTKLRLKFKLRIHIEIAKINEIFKFKSPKPVIYLANKC